MYIQNIWNLPHKLEQCFEKKFAMPDKLPHKVTNLLVNVGNLFKILIKVIIITNCCKIIYIEI
jgi:hypothetical protein